MGRCRTSASHDVHQLVTSRYPLGWILVVASAQVSNDRGHPAGLCDASLG